jgi:transposase-like protein
VAGSKRYSDKDKALVRTLLEANGGNVKRTARDLDMPPATVRAMKQKWEREGLPASVSEVLPVVAGDFVEDVSRVRNKMINNLEAQVDANKLTPKDNLLGIGILTDKARLVEGKSTSRSENTSDGNLPIEQVRELFAGFAQGIVEAATQRDAAISSATGEEPIEDAEWEQVRPLTLLPAS